MQGCHITIFGKKIGKQWSSDPLAGKTIKNTIITHITIVPFKYPNYHAQTVFAKHQNGHSCPKSY